MGEEHPTEVNISLICLNYNANYSYEIVPPISNFVFTESSQLSYYHFLSALTTNSAILTRGPSGIGKKEIYKTLSVLLGKAFYSFNFLCQSNIYCLKQALIGTARGGFWLQIDNLQTMDNGFISSFIEMVFMIRKAIIYEDKKKVFSSIFFSIIFKKIKFIKNLCD